MRVVVWSTILALAAVSGWGQSPKKRVAVFDFDNAAVQGGMKLPFVEMSAPNLGKAAADLLITKLVQDGNVSVIERNAIDKLLAEQNLTNSDRTDPVTAAKLGKVLESTPLSWAPLRLTITLTRPPAGGGPASAALAAV